MQRITSAQNNTIKRIRALGASAKDRREAGQTLFEGVHLCEAYLAGGQEPAYVVISDSAASNPEVIAIAERFQQESCLIVPDSLFSSLSTVANGVGILFVVSIPEVHEAPALDDDALVLDDVQDPGNLGTMLRTAVAAGVKRVYLSKGSSSAWAPKVVRAGMGAHLNLEIYENVDLSALVRAATVPVFATSLSAEQTIYEANLVPKSAWLFGTEGRGVSDDLLALCGDATVVIPQTEGVESLNVAAAAAVCLFEQRRQRLG